MSTYTGLIRLFYQIERQVVFADKGNHYHEIIGCGNIHAIFGNGGDYLGICVLNRVCGFGCSLGIGSEAGANFRSDGSPIHR